MEEGSLECFSASSDRDFLVAMGGLNFRPLFQFSISHFENDPSDFRMNRALLMIYNSTGIIDFNFVDRPVFESFFQPYFFSI